MRNCSSYRLCGTVLPAPVLLVCSSSDVNVQWPAETTEEWEATSSGLFMQVLPSASPSAPTSTLPSTDRGAELQGCYEVQLDSGSRRVVLRRHQLLWCRQSADVPECSPLSDLDSDEDCSREGVLASREGVLV